MDDLVKALIKMMEQDGFIGPVNLGNPSEFTILQLAEKIKEKLSSTTKIKFMPLPQDDPKQRQPNISLAKEKLGWEPTVSLDDGLSKAIDYFRKELNK